MNPSEIEARVSALEAEVANLKRQSRGSSKAQPWWDRIAGTFANDPAFVEAMRLGREYRESTYPDFDAMKNADFLDSTLDTKDEGIAGNGGDLVKHTVYLAVLDYLTEREPWGDGIRLRECHAGKGFYRAKDEPRRRLLRCLFDPINSSDGPALHNAQRENQLALGTWPTRLDDPRLFYSGSAALNAWALSRGSRGSHHRLELYEQAPGTRAALRDLFAALEKSLHGLNVTIFPEQEDGQPFDGEVYIEQMMARWGEQDAILLDPFAKWSGSTDRDRTLRRVYRRIFDQLSAASPSEMPCLLMFWTWGNDFPTARSEIGKHDRAQVPDGYRAIRSIVSGRGRRYIRISWTWQLQFAMWVFVPNRHLDAMKSAIETRCAALAEHLAAKHCKALFADPSINVAVE